MHSRLIKGPLKHESTLWWIRVLAATSVDPLPSLLPYQCPPSSSAPYYLRGPTMITSIGSRARVPRLFSPSLRYIWSRQENAYEPECSSKLPLLLRCCERYDEPRLEKYQYVFRGAEAARPRGRQATATGKVPGFATRAVQ